MDIIKTTALKANIKMMNMFIVVGFKRPDDL